MALSKRWGSLAVALLALVLNGCIERKMLIRSEPSGAQVTLNSKPVGTTPSTTDFLFYGAYEIGLSAPHCYRRRIVINVTPPLYQRPPLDFFVECFWPFTVTDRHEFVVQLEPMKDIRELTHEEQEDLILRADQTRRDLEHYEKSLPNR